MTKPIRPATWDDLEDVPEGFIGEIVGGEIRMMPRPDPPHLQAAMGLGIFVGSRFHFGWDGPGGWVILAEPRIRFEEDIRVPDIAGWKADRYAIPQRGPYVVAPDWLCEVLSPSTTREDRSEKLPLYARAGVAHTWLVDPDQRTVEVYRRTGEQWLLVAVHAGEERVRAEPFDAVEIDLALVWGPSRTP